MELKQMVMEGIKAMFAMRATMVVVVAVITQAIMEVVSMGLGLGLGLGLVTNSG